MTDFFAKILYIVLLPVLICVGHGTYENASCIQHLEVRAGADCVEVTGKI